jgi:hypothetical protein
MLYDGPHAKLPFIAFVLQHLRCRLYAGPYVHALIYIAAVYIMPAIELQVSKNAAPTYVPLSHLTNCGNKSVSEPSILKRIMSGVISLNYGLARLRIGEHEYTREGISYAGRLGLNPPTTRRRMRIAQREE